MPRDVASPSDALSPAMRQYQQYKAQYPDYVLFFRMGDFYEMFWEDAKLASRVLGVALTSRSRGGPDAADAIPMAGVPFHAVEQYLRRMIAAGHKVAICEQTESASAAKGVIRREVTRLMTPGTLTDDPLLEGRSDNFLAAMAFHVSGAGYGAGLAWVDLSTGACVAASGDEGQILDELTRLRPAELLLPELPSGQPHPLADDARRASGAAITPRPSWQFTSHHALEQLQRQWQVRGAAGFGFANDDPAVLSIGAALSYLHETQKGEVGHLRAPRRHVVDDHLIIDPASFRSLEIDRTVRSGGAEGSLLHAIDRTRTAMGGRMLRQWLRHPLRDREHIEARLDAVAALVAAPQTLKPLSDRLDRVCDIERVLGRVAVNRAGPRDLAALGATLAAIPSLFERLESAGGEPVAPELRALLPACAEQAAALAAAIRPDPQPHLREGGVIADGFDAELDRLRALSADSQQWLASYQAKLAAETSIPSLRVSYNKVFGYYIEVTDAHRGKVPAAWTRRQTVRNAERYVTAELKQFESDALSARDRAVALEQTLFEQVRQSLLPHVPTLQDLASTLARIDVLVGLAGLALQRRYCRPRMVDAPVLDLSEGRHPVLEQSLGSEFVSNDARFDEGDSLQLITGPNMAGKSTFIRQVALIALMAHIGSFVPARSATVGLVDRLFARIGASDELHAGQSTFMVEMTETANILNNATSRSLVILDEIGRGTSTLDGLSLAWAIAEHLGGSVRCRTLFATHYHELTDLSERLEGVRNLNVAVREWEDQVVFLHRIIDGGADRSYGIHVARLAGVPRGVLQRARQLLGELSVTHAARPASKRRGEDGQLTLFAPPPDPLRRAFDGVDVETLTPMQAFDLLRRWKEQFSAP